MDLHIINRESQLTESFNDSITPISDTTNELALPLDRSKKISGIWNKTYAFFTKGLIGKAATSTSYLIGREVVGGLIGSSLFNLIGSNLGQIMGEAAIPTIAISMATICINNPKLNQLPVSKSVLATGFIVTTIATQIFFSEYLGEIGSSIGGYLFTAIGGLAGETLLAYATDSPKLPIKEYVKNYIQLNGTAMLLQTLVPSPALFGKLRDRSIFHVLSNKDSIIAAYKKTNSLINSLKDQDIGEVTQSMLKESGKISFLGGSILISAIPRFIRVAIRSFNKYSPLTQSSPKITSAQESLRTALMSSDKTAIERAKKSLVVEIQKEMKKHFDTVGIADTVTKPIFEKFLKVELDKFDIQEIEEKLLGFAITDDINQAYSKILLEIHARSFLAFAAVDLFHENKQLSKQSQVLFFENILEVFMSHYIRIAPDSKALEYTNATLSTVVKEGVRFIISDSIELEADIALEEQSSSLNQPLTEGQKNTFKAALKLIASLFTSFFRAFYNLFIRNDQNPQTISEVDVLQESIRGSQQSITDSDSILSSEEIEINDDFTLLYIIRQLEEVLSSEDFIENQITEITDSIIETDEEDEEFFTPAESLAELEKIIDDVENTDEEDFFEDALEI